MARAAAQVQRTSFLVRLYTRFASWNIPDGFKIFLVVTTVSGLASYQVVYGKTKGQALSQEKPDVMVHTKGPRNFEEEKAMLSNTPDPKPELR